MRKQVTKFFLLLLCYLSFCVSVFMSGLSVYLSVLQCLLQKMSDAGSDDLEEEQGQGVGVRHQ